MVVFCPRGWVRASLYSKRGMDYIEDHMAAHRSVRTDFRGLGPGRGARRTRTVRGPARGQARGQARQGVCRSTPWVPVLKIKEERC